MSRHILMTAGVLLCLTLGASAQAPSPDAMSAARSLVTTMKLGDQYKALLPVILLNLKPTLVQDRPEIERDLRCDDGNYRGYLYAVLQRDA